MIVALALLLALVSGAAQAKAGVGPQCRIACPNSKLRQPSGASASERWQELGVGPQRKLNDDKSALLAQASAAVTAGRRDEARQLLRTAAERFQSVQALLQLARLQSADGDATAAIDTLRKARALAPNAEDVLNAFAQVSLAARMPVPAILTLESLTRLCPSVGQYHYLLGVALMTAGDMTAAVESLKLAADREPNRPLTLVALGLAYNNQKRFADAREPLARSLELAPDSVEALAALAETEAGLGDFAAAETHASRALATAPDNATANLVIGTVRMTQQRYPEARDALVAAAAADPRSPKPEYQLSLVYARLGDEAAAQRHVERYQQKLREMEAAVKALHEAGFVGGPSTVREPQGRPESRRGATGSGQGSRP
jgi:tetratricopeptide (TPR) repeat protein